MGRLDGNSQLPNGQQVADRTVWGVVIGGGQMCWELPVTERTNTKKSLFWRLVGGLALGWGGWVKGLLLEEYHYGTMLPSHLRVGAARGQMC